jgi:hypothetical protein
MVPESTEMAFASPADVAREWERAMRAGDFEGAWRATDSVEAARRTRGWRDESAGDLLWDGTPFDRRRVLIRCLHGLGDTLQFMRFAPTLRDSAASVTLAAQPVLLDLLSAASDCGRVIDGWVREFPEHDVEVEVMELPYALRITSADLPGRIPYLDAAGICSRSGWQPPARESRRLRVGLIWKSSDWDLSRSVPVDALAELRNAGTEFYSLQQNATADELAALPIRCFSLADQTENPLDAAAAMQWLDLIITVDSMPAHLAGALGRPVWTLLKAEADWRWMDDRTDSPWYPTMRLFRNRRGWCSLLADVAAELRHLRI